MALITIATKHNTDYDMWLEKVSHVLSKKYGTTLAENPYNYRTAYQAGMSHISAANRAVIHNADAWL